MKMFEYSTITLVGDLKHRERRVEELDKLKERQGYERIFIHITKEQTFLVYYPSQS